MAATKHDGVVLVVLVLVVLTLDNGADEKDAGKGAKDAAINASFSVVVVVVN